ncbi:MAG TPA: dTDP-glucose 4,6-dehydratase [Candidatus Latescibacteria bacterium]|nr:dTDP-glucose 4,6-dehydratase [Candidatus Latescibacterota bacterium]
MKLLVTGGAGFIGSNFVRYVLGERPDWEVVNLDKLTYAGNLENLKDVEDHPRYRFVRGDIADRELMDHLFSEESFDAVANFAAESHVDRSILDPTPFLRTNVQGTQVLLEAARKYKVGRFLQVSTDEVYGSLGETGRFTEESPLLPNSPYAASKAAADLLCRAYHRTYGLPVVITRSSNNYGPYQLPEKLIPLMTLNALEGKPLPVYGKGENIRDWLYVEDNCRAIALVLQRGKDGEVYNIGGGQELRNIDVVERICELLACRIGRDEGELKALITFVEDRPGHDFRYALSCDKVRRLDWSPEVSFDLGLERTIDWYLKNWEWVGRVRSGEYKEYYERIYGPRGVT